MESVRVSYKKLATYESMYKYNNTIRKLNLYLLSKSSPKKNIFLLSVSLYAHHCKTNEWMNNEWIMLKFETKINNNTD